MKNPVRHQLAEGVSRYVIYALMAAVFATMAAETYYGSHSNLSGLFVGILLAYTGWNTNNRTLLVCGGIFAGMAWRDVAHALVRLAFVVALLLSPSSARAATQPCGAYIPPEGCSECQLCGCSGSGTADCHTTITCYHDTQRGDWCSHTLCEPGICSAPPAPTPLPTPTPVPTEPQRLLPDLKKWVHTTGQVVNFVSKAMVTIGGYVAASSKDPRIQLEAAGAIFMGTMMNIGGDFMLAMDPFDPDYRELWAVDIPPLKFPLWRYAAAVRPTLRQFLVTEQTINAYWEAVHVTINRANSALAEGDREAERTQIQALEAHLDTLADLYARDLVLRPRLRNQLLANGYRRIWNQERTRNYPDVLISPKLMASVRSLVLELRAHEVPAQATVAP